MGSGKWINQNNVWTSKMIYNWEQEMHAKYSTMYNYYYNTPTITNFGPSFSSQWQCDEWASYVQMRKEGSIKCPCCGK